MQALRRLPGSAFQQWRGVWVGVWRGDLKHILLVESVSEDGAAMSYAIGDNPSARIQPRWLRLEGIVSGRTLTWTVRHSPQAMRWPDMAA